jgi:hypothetical protein
MAALFLPDKTLHSSTLIGSQLQEHSPKDGANVVHKSRFSHLTCLEMPWQTTFI